VSSVSIATDTLTANGGADADVISAAGLAAATIRLVLRGGQGNDTMTGSSGDDQFAWFPGDASETIRAAANGSRLRFTRNIGSVVLDAAAVERLTLAAMGGSDTISLGDISQTGLRQVAFDLAGPSTPAGDGQPDTISITAQTSDAIATTLGPGTMSVTWVGARYLVTGVEPGNDRLLLADRCRGSSDGGLGSGPGSVSPRAKTYWRNPSVSLHHVATRVLV
jgi:hypothetical protein